MTRRALAAALVAACLAAPAGPWAQEPPDPPGEPAPAPEQAPPAPEAPPGGERRLIQPGPGGVALEIAAGPGSILGKDELILKGYVDIKFGDTRLQADYVRYVPSTKEATAEGNVILDKGGARISAERLHYNLQTETGTFHKARGYAEPSYYFDAERIEKISADELVLHDATFTACTQPIPYWSFRIGRGLLRLDDYAYLHNVSFKVRRVPVFFTPYLVWPIKTDRASGLLFPQFGFSRRGGTVISNAFYWAMRRNMDATFYLDYLSLAGYGTGVEYRYVPSATGRGVFTGYFIRDQVAKQEDREGVPVNRWVINYGHNQNFDSGWRMVANANFISDFDYYLDFERDLRLSTNPQAVSNLFITRNRGFFSLNLRGERREQLINVALTPAIGEPFFQSEEQSIVRWIRPEIELRGRRQRLGRTPFYLSLEASANNLSKGVGGAEYQRFDAFPVFSSVLSPVPWLDIDASAGYRDTFYTKSQLQDLGCDNVPDTGDAGEGNGVQDAERDESGDGIFDAGDDLGCDRLPLTGDFGEGNGILDREDAVILDEELNRGVLQAGLTIIGPKLSRVFDRPDSRFSPQYKHTIEPQVRYAYRSAVHDPERVIPFDEIDVISGDTNRVTYALVTRLFAKRPTDDDDFGVAPGSLEGTEYVGGGGDPFAEVRRRQRERQELSLFGPSEGGAAGTDDAGDEGAEEAAAAGGPGAAPPGGAPPPKEKRLNTVEIASLEISQDYSFLGPLSTSTGLGFPGPPRQENVSPVRATLRFNPSSRTSIDVRTSYDVLFRAFREASLSANLRSPRLGFLDLTWSVVRDLEGAALAASGLGFGTPFDRNQIGLMGETSLMNRRLLLGLQANYELGDLLAGQPRLRDQRYKMGYNTQCCGVQFEVLNRHFLGTSQREFRFLINLKGVGNVIDLNSGSGGSLPGTFPGTYGGFQ